MTKWLEAAQKVKAAHDAELTEKNELINTLTSARDKLQAFVAVTDWGTLSTGTAIAAGDIVRYGVLEYTAKLDHTKALTRSPLNIVYWEPITDSE